MIVKNHQGLEQISEGMNLIKMLKLHFCSKFKMHYF